MFIMKNVSLVSVTPNQIERLYSRFTSLDRGDCGTLSREDFLRIPELAINPLGERIVNAFFVESSSDRVNFLQFMQVLAHFRPIKKNSLNILNSREEKLRCKWIGLLIYFFLYQLAFENSNFPHDYLIRVSLDNPLTSYLIHLFQLHLKCMI